MNVFTGQGAVDLTDLQQLSELHLALASASNAIITLG